MYIAHTAQHPEYSSFYRPSILQGSIAKYQSQFRAHTGNMPPENDHLTSLENLTDQAIPIPIQIFLWKQVAPFVRPKLGKLHEASCMVNNTNTNKRIK